MPSNNDFLSSLTNGVNPLGAAKGRFASPWVDVASQYAPKTFKDALTLCEYLYVNNDTYREASERIVSYFLTKLKYDGQSDGEIKKFKGIFEGKFQAMERIRELGNSYMAYGNAFASVIPPFIRMLRCTSCKKSWKSIKETPFNFNHGDLSFYARCNTCKQTCRHMVHDFPDPNPDRIKFKCWDPKAITIQESPFSVDMNYWLEVDPWVASQVRGDNKFLVSTTPWSFLEAISKNQKYLFNPEYIFHLKESCIPGIALRGWGLPSILSSFKSFFRLQVIQRYDEVMMMDYIVPIRILSPALGSASGAAGNQMIEIANMNNFRGAMEAGVARHRIDGADWNFLPFPVEYQAVGGEGLTGATKELLANQEDRLLNARGMPPEMYRGTLTLQAAPMALRLFERIWGPLVSGNNEAAQWMATVVSRLIKAGDIDVSLESVELADDIEARNLRLQLMQAQLISRDTGLSGLGIDSKGEKRRILEELKGDQREEMKAQQELQMEAMNLNTPEGDAEGSAQQQQVGGATPMDVQGQGVDFAKKLEQMPPEEQRRQINMIREQNPTLHAVVMKERQKLRGEASLLGRAAGMQQLIGEDQQQQAGPPPAQ